MSNENGRSEPWNKGRTLPPEPLSADEAERLIRAASARCPTGQRNRAMLVCMYRGGLRCQEVLDLMPKDIDTTAGTIRVLRGKGNKTRLVGIDNGAMAIIQRWLDTRGEMYDGTPVENPADLRQALLKRPEPLIRTFTENLMAYALGRRVEYYDQPTIRAIVKEGEADDYRMSSFILGVVMSDAFQMQRVQAVVEEDDRNEPR